MMTPCIIGYDSQRECDTVERCAINELSNSDKDPQLSIARARVKPGITTRWHSLSDTDERYVILSGHGMVEIGDMPAQSVQAGDVVVIPRNCRQRICNDGTQDLIFLAICTPRFRSENYHDLDSSDDQPAHD